MLQRNDGKLEFPKHRIKYTQHGRPLEALTSDLEWWVKFEELWSHTEINLIEDLNYTDEQLARLEEIQFLDNGFEHIGYRYALDGVFPDEYENEDDRMMKHPLETIKLQKNQITIGQMMSDKDIEMLEKDFYIQMLGQQVTELELQLLEK